ncbi:hypothetical protein [Helicobacter sp.]|nr:hypothetical protein [Helicobacter sp.]MBR2495425.1 hypothetical protein [Helicobacter sp.]
MPKKFIVACSCTPTQSNVSLENKGHRSALADVSLENKQGDVSLENK